MGGRIKLQILGKKPQVHGIIIREWTKRPAPPPSFYEILIILPLVHFVRPPVTFISPVTSTNVRISPQNILLFIFSPLVTLVENFKAISSASPKLSNFNQNDLLKTLIFLDKHDHIWNIMWDTRQIFLVISWTELWRHILYFKIPLF